MHLTLLILLFCGLTSAQDVDVDVTENTETQLLVPPDTSELHREIGTMKERLAAFENRLTESEKLIEELKSKDKSDVIFSAAVNGAGSVGPFNTETILVFQTVMINIGNAYNQHTGVFVTPVSGNYYFTFFYHAGGEHPVTLHLYKNDQIVSRTHDQQTQNDKADNGGNAVILQLQKGDQVFVRMNANTHIWAYHHITTFSGFLIS